MLSRWLDESPLAREDEAPALKSDIRADVCIIGGGYRDRRNESLRRWRERAWCYPTHNLKVTWSDR